MIIRSFHTTTSVDWIFITILARVRERGMWAKQGDGGGRALRVYLSSGCVYRKGSERKCGGRVGKYLVRKIPSDGFDSRSKATAVCERSEHTPQVRTCKM